MKWLIIGIVGYLMLRGSSDATRTIPAGDQQPGTLPWWKGKIPGRAGADMGQATGSTGTSNATVPAAGEASRLAYLSGFTRITTNVGLAARGR